VSSLVFKQKQNDTKRLYPIGYVHFIDQLVDLPSKPDIRRKRVLRSNTVVLWNFTDFNDKGAIGFDWVTIG
tara:strand:+ start:361 stop:573 length:213 start_codon:yes stop_codon:yes gene_type:complete